MRKRKQPAPAATPVRGAVVLSPSPSGDGFRPSSNKSVEHVGLSEGQRLVIHTKRTRFVCTVDGYGALVVRVARKSASDPLPLIAASTYHEVDGSLFLVGLPTDGTRVVLYGAGPQKGAPK